MKRKKSGKKNNRNKDRNYSKKENKTNYKDDSKSSTNNTNSESANSTTISESDLRELNLLDIQLKAQVLGIIANILAYISTEESIQLVYSKYTEEEEKIPNPDLPALQSAYIALLVQVVFTELGFSRYNDLYEKYLNGELKYSLEPNIKINIANVLGIISSIYGLQATQEFYRRSTSQPIVGI